MKVHDAGELRLGGSISKWLRPVIEAYESARQQTGVSVEEVEKAVVSGYANFCHQIRYTPAWLSTPTQLQYAAVRAIACSVVSIFAEQMTSRKSDGASKDIVERLREACNGHPHAKIPWPHHLLHDAVAEIEQLRAALTHQGGKEGGE